MTKNERITSLENQVRIISDLLGYDSHHGYLQSHKWCATLGERLRAIYDKLGIASVTVKNPTQREIVVEEIKKLQKRGGKNA